jgi:NTE family protein
VPTALKIQRPLTGLVLSGGGSRGAYQAGVLKAVGEIAAGAGLEWPFEICTGLSAGAINCTHLVSSKDSLQEAAMDLAAIWSDLTSDQVFRTDPASLSSIAARWLAGVATGGATRGKKPQSLVDTEPLRDLIASRLDASAIDSNIARGRLHAACISATEYATSRGVSFIQGHPSIPLWRKARTISMAQRLRVEHVMASSAIPLLFPAIKIGHRHYGDGCLRNLTPLLPAIEMGAARLFIIGVRREMDIDDVPRPGSEGATAGRVLSVILNAVLMDGLEADLDYLARINRLIEDLSQSGTKYRKVPFLMIRPSKDIATIAIECAEVMPPLVRYLTRGLGPIAQTAELISYLLFHPQFCRELINLGYSDAMAISPAIEGFLRGEAT